MKRPITIGLETSEDSDTLNELLDEKAQMKFKQPGFPDAVRQVKEDIGVEVKQVCTYITDKFITEEKNNMLLLLEYLESQGMNIDGAAISYDLYWLKVE